MSLLNGKDFNDNLHMHRNPINDNDYTTKEKLSIFVAQLTGIFAGFWVFIICPYFIGKFFPAFAFGKTFVSTINGIILSLVFHIGVGGMAAISVDSAMELIEDKRRRFPKETTDKKEDTKKE